MATLQLITAENKKLRSEGWSYKRRGLRCRNDYLRVLILLRGLFSTQGLKSESMKDAFGLLWVL